jgi:hypothetical protein
MTTTRHSDLVGPNLPKHLSYLFNRYDREGKQEYDIMIRAFRVMVGKGKVGGDWGACGMRF